MKFERYEIRAVIAGPPKALQSVLQLLGEHAEEMTYRKLGRVSLGKSTPRRYGRQVTMAVVAGKGGNLTNLQRTVYLALKKQFAARSFTRVQANKYLSSLKDIPRTSISASLTQLLDDGTLKIIKEAEK